MSTSARHAREYRRRMREAAWLTAEAHREALALAAADRNSDDMDFVEAITDPPIGE